MLFANDVNVLGGSVHTIKKNKEALIVASKGIELEINAGTSKYMVMLEIRMQDKVTIKD